GLVDQASSDLGGELLGFLRAVSDQCAGHGQADFGRDLELMRLEVGATCGEWVIDPSGIDAGQDPAEAVPRLDSGENPVLVQQAVGQLELGWPPVEDTHNVIELHNLAVCS